MKRWHLVELEDLPWVPRVIRDGATDVLDWMFARLGMYRPTVDKLRALLDATGERDIVDLCSGGAGGAMAMHGYLRERGDTDTRLVLTDRYPNQHAAERIEAAGDAGVRYRGTQVDALAVPSELRGVRTMYSALHHFRPADVTRLIASAVADRAPIAFFDIAAQPALRRVPDVLVPLFALVNFAMIFPLVLVMVPFVRPLKASRLGFTYLIPLIPLLYAWDGTVSALRAYTPEELVALARQAPGAAGYRWEAGRAGSGPRSVLYLIGTPDRITSTGRRSSASSSTAPPRSVARDEAQLPAMMRSRSSNPTEVRGKRSLSPVAEIRTLPGWPRSHHSSSDPGVNG